MCNKIKENKSFHLFYCGIHVIIIEDRIVHTWMSSFVVQYFAKQHVVSFRERQ